MFQLVTSMHCFSSYEGSQSLQSDKYFLANRINVGRRKYEAIVAEERWLQLDSVGVRDAQNTVNPVCCVSRGLICRSNLYVHGNFCSLVLSEAIQAARCDY